MSGGTEDRPALVRYSEKNNSIQCQKGVYSYIWSLICVKIKDFDLDLEIQ